MPKSTGKLEAKTKRQANLYINSSSSGPELEESLGLTPGTSSNEQSGPSSSVNENDDLKYVQEMTNTFKMFSYSVKKTLHAKQTRMASLTSNAIVANQKMVSARWTNSLDESKELVKHLAHTSSVLDQTKADIKKLTAQNKETVALVCQHIEANVRNRDIITQRVAACRKVNDTLQKQAQEQDVKHRKEMIHVQYKLKKELSKLKKNIL